MSKCNIFLNSKSLEMKRTENSAEDKRYQSTSLQSSVISESLMSREAVVAPEDRTDVSLYFMVE